MPEPKIDDCPRVHAFDDAFTIGGRERVPRR